MNNFEMTVDGVEYRISQITCLGDNCSQFLYQVSTDTETCQVVASLDSEMCMSGSLDPEMRQAACGQLKSELIKSIREHLGNQS